MGAVHKLFYDTPMGRDDIPQIFHPSLLLSDSHASPQQVIDGVYGEPGRIYPLHSKMSMCLPIDKADKRHGKEHIVSSPLLPRLPRHQHICIRTVTAEQILRLSSNLFEADTSPITSCFAGLAPCLLFTGLVYTDASSAFYARPTTHNMEYICGLKEGLALFIIL